ncbi:MAG: ABC transporter ATP-binding protein/permease [Rhizobiaceae bacterium]|nr:ABC transporter ATP-binding protein/permease [Rhizobiaceae bacterium]
MEPSLLRYIWTHTWRQQLWIVAIVVLSMIPYYMSFDLPKLIVNGPIQGDGFSEPDATQPFMNLAYDLPFVGHVELFAGFQLNREEMLFGLSMIFLLLVVINGLFKLYINTYKGRLGERMLRRVRYQLVDLVLRFPTSHFKRVKSAEVATMIKDEVEPMGGFIGDAFVQPVFLGGQALTALVFIMVQSFWLGLIALAIVMVQIVLIPKMRRRLLVLGRERQLTARELSGRVGEIVDGIGAIHINDTSNFERADIAARLGRIFKIRYDLYQWKFMVKFINNFLAQVTPFLFYMIGGYLALEGRLDVGQLVAVIAAYKDLPGPMKDLIDWDQMRQDVQVKYAQVVEQFTVDRVLDAEHQKVTLDAIAPMNGALAAVNLTIHDDSGAPLMEHVSFEMHPGERVALVGTVAGGVDSLAEAFARLTQPASGRITSGEADLLDVSEAVTGRRMAYASSDVSMFQGTLRDNLLYGLKHAPLRPKTYDEHAAAHRKWEIAEARSAGNPDYDILSDWIDYEAAGVGGPEELYQAIRPVLETVLLSRDVLDLGLRAPADPGHHAKLVERIGELRGALRSQLDRSGMSDMVVPFEPGTYNREATIGENLLFGAATGPGLRGKELADNPYFVSVLKESGLGERLYEMGIDIAEQAIELFADLPPDHPFFQQLTFMTPEEIPAFQALLQKVKGKKIASVSAEDRAAIISLSFAYIEPRHRFGLLTDELMQKIVEVRETFYRNLPVSLKGAIERYDPARYTAAASVMDNILFGRISHNQADGAEKIRTMVCEILDEYDVYDEVLDIGLGYNVGVGGRRLSGAQRQKLDLARAVLKRADFLIVNRPLLALDSRTQEQILQNVLEEVRRGGRNPAVLWVVGAPSMAKYFDRVLVFDGSQLAGDGTSETLSADNGIFKSLVS